MNPSIGSGGGIRQLPLESWPDAMVVVWRNAINSRRGRSRSPETYKSYAGAVGTYLWYCLQSNGRLDAEALLTDLVTPELIEGYFDYLQHHGNAPYSILGRFGSLHAALRMMHPEGDFGFVTKPDGLPLRRMMEMRRRVLFVPDARHNVFWAEALFRDALALSTSGRRLQVRDAAIIGIFAELAPRARAMQGLRLRHLQRHGEEWILRQEGSIMKRQQTILELPLSARVGAILDRYFAVERHELMQGQNHDAVWIAKVGGGPLMRDSLNTMIKARSKERYGISFGPQRFRTSLTTTQAMVAGNRPFDPSLILGHSPTTSLRYYNRAQAVEATRAHDECITALENGPDRLGL